MSDTAQVERQLFILQLLAQEQRGWTLQQINKTMKRFGIDVNMRTIRRDIDDLSMCFFIYEEKESRHTVYYANKYNIGRLSFDFNDLMALHFMKKLVEPYNGIDIGKKASKMLDKIIKETPSIQQAWTGTLDELLYVTPTDLIEEKKLNVEIIDALHKAIEESRSVQIRYHAFQSNQVTERLLDPYLLIISEGCYHVVGYCHLRKEIRDFRIARILSIRITEQEFKRPSGFYQNYRKNRFKTMFGNVKELVRLRFTGFSARFVKEYCRQEADRLVDEPDGSVLFEREVAPTPDMVKWILGFGDGVEVLEPVGLRRRIAEILKKAAKIYENDIR